jgi:hypothetical protein
VPRIDGKLVIAQEADWQVIGRGDVVIDPLVLRYGEVFLQGRTAAGERADAKWRAIANDVGGLVLFLDQVVLRERIPVFNYGATFDMGLNLSERVLARVNDREEILIEVDVQYGPYMEAKAAALEMVTELFAEDRASLEGLGQEIIRHL